MGMSGRFFPCYCPIYGVQYKVLAMSTFPVTSIGHDVTGVQLFPLFFSRYNFPVVVVVELMGEIYTDTEICLPEIEIDGTTVFVLSHKGAMVCADAAVPITAAFSAADTGTE